MLVLPQVGQETTSMPPVLKPRVLKISFADLISSTGSALNETRMVLPIPWPNIIPRPMEDLMFPDHTVPASVIPTWRGCLVLSAISSWALAHMRTSEDLIEITRLS